MKIGLLIIFGLMFTVLSQDLVLNIVGILMLIGAAIGMLVEFLDMCW